LANEKKELLHGLKLRLPGDRGLAVIDATRPVIGELLDYEFTCQVTDAVSQADEAQNLGQLIGSAGAYSQLLAPLGKQFRADLAIIEFLRKSRTPQADRFVEDLPQQQQPALFLSQHTETLTTSPGGDRHWQFSLIALIYVHTQADKTIAPTTLLNPIIDSVVAALLPDAITKRVLRVKNPKEN
jgi:hypothetical protein